MPEYRKAAPGGALRPLPDDGLGDRRRAVPGAGGAVQRVRSICGHGPGPCLVRAARGRLDRRGDRGLAAATGRTGGTEQEGRLQWQTNQVSHRTWATNGSARRSSRSSTSSPSPSASWDRCSRAAFLIPLIVGANAAAQGRGGCRAVVGVDRRDRRRSRSGGSWRSTPRRSTRPDRSTTTSRPGWATTWAPPPGGCTTAAPWCSRQGSAC